MNLFEITLDQHMDMIEYAGNMLDKHDLIDSSAPSLVEVTGISQHHMATASGLNDYDYQNLSNLTMGLKNVNQLELISKIPVPPEIMEHYNNIKCHLMMGLFPEIGRAWLTIDSDIYIWSFEHGRDVAYYDGLTDLIVSVGLVKPKSGVFVADVKYLLILTTPVEIVILGVTFGDQTISLGSTSPYDEMQLMNKPIFIVSTDNVAITTIVSSDDSRIFMGGRDGNLYEIAYQNEPSWFGKRCKKINHSQSVVSYIVPGFLKFFAEDDSILKIVIDSTRHLLYALSEKGAIEAWYIGTDPNSMRRIARISQNDIVHQASNILKTVDASVFKPIVSINPLKSQDCSQLHLIAVTQCGVRLYFSTVSLLDVANAQQCANVPGAERMHSAYLQPHNLYLQHVRLPPGYTANATSGKPKLVHSSHHSNGTVLMVSSAQQEQDLLWSLSSEPFPLRQFLAESSTILPLDGQVWAIAEMKPSSDEQALNMPLKNDRTNTKIVLLTNQGAFIVSLIKPMGLLMQILGGCHGAHHDAVKNYFHVQSEAQACLSALLIACMEAYRGTDMGLWATQAFILYGGEPQLANRNPLYNAFNETQGGPNPNIMVSTPYPMGQQSQMSGISYSPISRTNQAQQQQQSFAMQHIQQPQDIKYSPKHSGLYLYLIRLLRPIWKKKCIISTNGVSSLTHENCSEILSELYALKAFLEDVPLHSFSEFTSANVMSNDYAQSTMVQQKSTLEQAIFDDEKRSINALSLFIKHTCEVIALWKILCEHQFNLLFQALPKDEQNSLSASTFRDLILSRSDTCALFIVSLLNSYLNDNTTVSSISSKLRDVCPTLYRHEDAVLYKATEILMLSKSSADPEERQNNLYMALQLCKDAAPDLPLLNICQQFTAAKYYHGVIELCAVCASKKDVNNAALHFYNNNEPIEDQEGYAAYTARMNYYKPIKAMLDQIYHMHNIQNQSAQQNQTAIDNNSMNNSVLETVALALQTSDPLLHVTIYEWLLSYNFLSELLNISEPTLGEFLVRSVAKSPQNIKLADLLWKFYERNGQHAAATKILVKLASSPNSELQLTERIEYLARAVMCMRSESNGYSASTGVALIDIEDKLEIARVQKMILDALSSVNSHDAQNACQNLNYQLYDINDLYSNFVERFDLSECKLKILHCSHHNDPLLIESVWTEIINKELAMPGSPEEKMTRLLLKMQLLSKEYRTSGYCFPLAFLVHELELRACKLRLSPSPVPETLINAMNIDSDLLLDIYARMISVNERVWQNEGNEWHLVESTTRLVDMLISQSHLIPIRGRTRVVAKAQELVSACRNLLYPKPNTEQMQNKLHEIEAKLKRVLY